MTEGHLASPRAKARFAAAALLGLAYAVGTAAITLGPPPPFSADANGTHVASVAPGSYVWALGIRPGLAIQPWPADTSTPGYSVSFEDGLTVDVASRMELPLAETALLALALLAGAVIAKLVGLPGSSVAMGLSAAVALGPLTPALGYPAGLALGLVPPTVTALDVVGSSPGLGRPWIYGMGAILLLVLAVPALATVMPGLAWPWESVWKSPALAVLAVGLVSTGLIVSRALGGGGSWRERVSCFTADAVPVARSSRLVGSAIERRRLAAEMHNTILPQLGQAILEIDARDPAGRERLSHLAGQLRREMSERQMTTLEHGGLVAAIDGYVHMLEVPLELINDNPTKARAPQRVEHAAYRVAQLAIANAVQHSGADAIRVEVIESKKELTLKVVDDGVGIDELAERAAAATGHIGLTEMRAQAQEVAAQFAVHSQPDMGTTIEFRWTR